jgi:hypothetical protein
MNYVNGELLCDVIHIEWDDVTPIYTKVVPKTDSQLAIDPDGEEFSLEMDTDKYEARKAYHDANVAKGEYKVVTKYLKQKREATRIGGIIDIDRRKVPNKKRSIDNPTNILSTTYISYIHGRVNGTTVSLQQIIENFDNLYNVVQYQKGRELSKGFGKILTIDRSASGPKDKLSDKMYKMAEDGIYEYDSSAAGNLGGRQLDPAMMFKMVDLSNIESLQYYDMLLNNIGPVIFIPPRYESKLSAEAKPIPRIPHSFVVITGSRTRFPFQ